MKSIVLTTFGIDLPPQKKVKDIFIYCFYWCIGNWLTLNWINCLCLIAYTITIPQESNNLDTSSNLIKFAWKNLELSFTSFCYGRAASFCHGGAAFFSYVIYPDHRPSMQYSLQKRLSHRNVKISHVDMVGKLLPYFCTLCFSPIILENLELSFTSFCHGRAASFCHGGAAFFSHVIYPDHRPSMQYSLEKTPQWVFFSIFCLLIYRKLTSKPS